MAISGVVDADINTIADKLGISRRQLADLLGYTYQAPTVTVTDATAHAAHVVIANMFGMLTIDYGDGHVIAGDPSSAGALTPADYTYASAGAKTVTVTGLGRVKTGSVTLA